MSTFIRQCAVCHAVWNPGTDTWDAHDVIIAVASHGFCDTCKITEMEKLRNEIELSGN